MYVLIIINTAFHSNVNTAYNEITKHVVESVINIDIQ